MYVSLTSRVREATTLRFEGTDMTHTGMQDQDADLVLWETQGGGLARSTEDGTYVWHELPDWFADLPDGDPTKAVIGDPIPEEWGTMPANESARDMMLDEEFPPELGRHFFDLD